ncbi:Dyp-type peroxidase [Curtobacterium flaccumfaciens pv. flaccumfaciens]|uniref:Dyp-type peroxidase n=1 Tax=Curtobacterium flaccumfaciens TaxID=2035 RepID=UPI001AD9C31A|nr:Dyp-type peroxidase [Curtobacterium flaccumfaciens]MBO9056891.1 Dyp-type peroxidase [Curtobacterium flaccumfaciens pv. flaccumfaciens]QVG65182.1 Dyp-type peroxidase [Curtobacterium flaccumfaciens pv. flaccumfaciens]
MPGAPGSRVPIDAQSVDAPLSRSAVFLTLDVGPDDDDLDAVRDVLSDLDGLLKTVGFRDLDAHLSCVVGIGAVAWDRFSPHARPDALHPFPALTGPVHSAPSTGGDLLFHIRGERTDVCFEFERLLLAALGDHVTVVDEVSGFRYFDTRDLLGFVDGTANPVAQDLAASALVGADDPDWAGGSYVVVQKYLHDLAAWNALGTDAQERIIGRSKSDNVERDSATEARPSHKSLATIVDDDGVEHDVLRDNMPFGRPGSGEYGTYFIGYSGALWVLERMLERMFVGDPPGTYDRLLDFSRAITGATFFAPARDRLVDLAALATPPSPSVVAAPDATGPGLGIGSLRSTEGHTP